MSRVTQIIETLMAEGIILRVSVRSISGMSNRRYFDISFIFPDNHMRNEGILCNVIRNTFFYTQTCRPVTNEHVLNNILH